MEDLIQIIERSEAPVKNLAWETSSNIRDHFPFSEIRAAQDMALSAIECAYAAGKKFVIIEAPTGVGKSGIAMAAASWAKTMVPKIGFEPGAYILTPQKTLQQQYMRDFASMGLLELKGKSNYWCHTFDTDCDSGSLLCGGEGGDAGDDRGTCEGCPYKMAKKAFKAGKLGQTNFAYFLNETVYAGQLKPRTMLVLDEGHNTEGQILGFADTEITLRRCDELNIHGSDVPFFKPGENAKVLVWLSDIFVPACQTFMRQLEDLMNDAKYDGRREDQVKYAKKLDAYDKFLCRLNRFINSDDHGNWLCWTDKDSLTLIIKPLTATLFAEEILFRKAQMIVIMSATILDFRTFMRNLGIKPEEAEIMAVPSEFPLENRPLFFRPVGNMSHKTIDATLPLMAAMVEKVLLKHADKKGIVHTHSYRINRYLVDYLKSKGLGHRIITHSGDIQGSRDQAVANHLTTAEPTVLFSPSMTEGLDLKEDLSRFQVIVKVPYPFLDPYVKARMQRDDAWYQWLTGLALVQATGRSVRSKTDKAVTYIFDQAFEYFLTKNQRALPVWWTDSIIFPALR